MALDIDGTITKQNRQLDISAIKAIRKAEEAGISIYLATGNILCFARTASVLLGTSGPLIAEDGGIVYDQSNGKKHILGGIEEIDKAVNLLKKEFDNVQQTETSDMREAGRTLKRTVDVEEAKDLFRKHDLNVTVVDSGFALHIKDSKVNKGNALEKAASISKCSTSELAAIGDAPNDVEMLQVAGLSFTPANASPEAKKASTYTTDSSYGAGVREAVNHILEGRDWDQDSSSS